MAGSSTLSPGMAFIATRLRSETSYAEVSQNKRASQPIRSKVLLRKGLHGIGSWMLALVPWECVREVNLSVLTIWGGEHLGTKADNNCRRLSFAFSRGARISHANPLLQHRFRRPIRRRDRRRTRCA